MAENPSAAWPIADAALSTKILDILQSASHYRQLRKGANESKDNLLNSCLRIETNLCLFSNEDPQPRHC